MRPKKSTTSDRKGRDVKLGLFFINGGTFALDPGLAIRASQYAEASGWESVWTGEHYVLPDPMTPDSPSPAGTPFLDPFLALAHIAANTTTPRLGTGVTVVPMHHPVRLATEIVTIDRLSGGRFEFGVGVGYLRAELDAFGVALSERASRLDESLDVLKALWTGEVIDHHGDHYDIVGVRAAPGPLARGGPRLHVGGHVDASYRRAVQRGTGWYGWDLTPEVVTDALAMIATAANHVERPPHFARLEITVTPPARTTPSSDVVDRYRAAGVDRLVFVPPLGRAQQWDDIEAFLDAGAASLT
jgi:probable F420-dependent oxidoreductase